jgi:uncharacterized protein (TIGR03083 family)
MKISDHIGTLRADGDLLASAAARIPLEADIPTCPGWQMRDLVRHVGSVHRWATGYVADRLQRPVDSIEDRGGPWPEDQALLAWFREGHAALLRTLENAPADLNCWTFLTAPGPLAHWARRQAHETAIHRVDAESADGEITPFAADFAADGIDELLICFVGRPGRGMRLENERVLHLCAPDAGRQWWVHVGPTGTTVSEESCESHCSVTGTASDLYMLLWNRRTADSLQVQGDASLLTQWRQSVHVRWS